MSVGRAFQQEWMTGDLIVKSSRSSKTWGGKIELLHLLHKIRGYTVAYGSSIDGNSFIKRHTIMEWELLP